MSKIDEKMLIREVMKTRKRNWDQKLREKEQAEQRKRYLENQGGCEQVGVYMEQEFQSGVWFGRQG